MIHFCQSYFVLDIGLTYTKCGMSKEALPTFIVPTPLTMISEIRNNISKVTSSTFAQVFEDKKKLRLEIEEFLTYIFSQ